MIYGLRIFSFLLGLAIGTLTSSSNAQANFPKHWSQLDIMRLQMEQSARNYEADRIERERSARKAEFEADQKEFKFTRETAALWLALMQNQEVFFQSKYPPPDVPSAIDIGKQLEINLIKQELLRREKQIRKHLEK